MREFKKQFGDEWNDLKIFYIKKPNIAYSKSTHTKKYWEIFFFLFKQITHNREEFVSFEQGQFIFTFIIDFCLNFNGKPIG